MCVCVCVFFFFFFFFFFLGGGDGGGGWFIPTVPPLKSPTILVGLSSSKMLLQSVDLFVLLLYMNVPVSTFSLIPGRVQY